MEKRISLKFPDINLLWGFAQILQSESIEIDTKNRTLICNCPDEIIALAIVDFSARVVEEFELGRAG